VLAPHRIIVGLNGGRRADPHLVRYTAMVARLGRRNDRHSLGAHASITGTSGRCETDRQLKRELTPTWIACDAPQPDPEFRFVLLGDDQEHRARRAALRTLVGKYFSRRRRKLAVGCDLFKHRAISRLPELVDDFDSDLLLVDDSAGTRRQLARLAVEAACPVWLVPRQSAPVLRKILVPLDFTHGSPLVLRAAVDLARRFPSARCIALHVERPTTRFVSGEASSRRREELLADFATLASYLDHPEVQVEPRIIERENIPRAIAESMANLSPDLTIFAARRRSRHTCGLLTSHTSRVIRASAGPVLVLRSPARPRGLLSAFREHWRDNDTPTFS
jgi:nucleotide-binding universal stress UspA family protein